jgi:uncharacterized protein (TIGR00255 family)
MSLKSMTGFARADGSRGATAWHWEVRAVNGRGLDIRLRLPPGLEGLEPRVRDAVGQRVVRGSLTITLNVQRSEALTEVRINEALLAEVLTALEAIRARLGGPPARAEALLGVRGVMELVERAESESEQIAKSQAMVKSLSEALDGVVSARLAEGRRLEAVIAGQLEAIERLVQRIEASPSRAPAAIRQRLKEQIQRILETGAGFDEGRLHQEAALLATRADVDEELKRLGGHILAARELLAAPQPAGRQLDFLAQEFNREANTLCAKAADGETAKAGLELKAVIDQMREQVQNIE